MKMDVMSSFKYASIITLMVSLGVLFLFSYHSTDFPRLLNYHPAGARTNLSEKVIARVQTFSSQHCYHGNIEIPIIHDEADEFDSLFVNEIIEELAGKYLELTKSGRFDNGGNIRNNSYSQRNQRYFAIIGSTLPQKSVRKEKMAYFFVLPLTVLAWRRIGFEVVVLFFEDADVWEQTLHNDRSVRLVFKILRMLKTRLFVFSCPGQHAVLLSQISRLFAASLLSNCLQPNDYLITTDADIWPVDPFVYHLKPGKRILSVNAFINYFVNRQNSGERLSYLELALSNIGASVKMWLEIMHKDGFSVDNITDVMKYMADEYGNRVWKPSSFAGPTWSLDQNLISVKIQNYLENRSSCAALYCSQNSKLHFCKDLAADKQPQPDCIGDFVKRQTYLDRVDRAYWEMPRSLDGIIDAHVIHNMHLEDMMDRTIPLLKLLYDNKTVSFILHYSQTFKKIYLSSSQDV